MLRKVQKNLECMKNKYGKDEAECMIAAVSGGADSVCLLLVLKELSAVMDFTLEAIHVEHGIRGEESMRDAGFVENLCKLISVPCHVVHVDVPSYCKERGLGTEEAARELRYHAFSEFALKKRGNIVLAHHMEDNAETVLFQMLRGSSLTGMCGISPCRQDEDGIWYLRPLLDVRRSEIEAYLREADQEYCTDSSNLETEYHRNYLRREVLPRLCEINSGAVCHISHTAAALSEVRDFLAIERDKAIERLVEKTDLGVAMDVPGLIDLHPALQKEVIYQVLSQVSGSKKDIQAVHVECVRELLNAQSGKRVILPYGVVASKSFHKLIMEKESGESISLGTVFISEEMLREWKETERTVSISLPKEGEYLEFRVFSFDGNMEKIPKKTYTKWLDYDKIKNGFCIRNRENGDFLISDTEGHRKKLKKYFIDEKIPLEERNTMWLLAQDSEVLWLVGGRISEKLKVLESTEAIIEIQYIGGK